MSDNENKQTKAPTPPVEVTRGQITERGHYGHAELPDRNKHIVFSLDDPYTVNNMRSCAKPVQPPPLTGSGADGDRRHDAA